METGESIRNTTKNITPDVLIQRNPNKQYNRMNMTDHTHYEIVSAKRIRAGDQFQWDYGDECKLPKSHGELIPEQCPLQSEMESTPAGRGLRRKHGWSSGPSDGDAPKMEHGRIQMSRRKQGREKSRRYGSPVSNQECNNRFDRISNCRSNRNLLERLQLEFQVIAEWFFRGLFPLTAS